MPRFADIDSGLCQRKFRRENFLWEDSSSEEWLLEATAFEEHSKIAPIILVFAKNVDRGVETRLQSAIGEIERECRVKGWDDSEAQPITKETSNEARALATLLPYELPLPNIVPAPTGSITFEWPDEHRGLVLTVKGKGVVNFMVLDEEGNRYGFAKFNGQKLPLAIKREVQAFFENDPAWSD